MEMKKINLKNLFHTIILTVPLLIITFSTSVLAAAPDGDWGRLSTVGNGYRAFGPNVQAVQQICTDAGFGSTIGSIDDYFGSKAYSAIKT